MSFIFLKKEAHYTIVVNMTNPGCQDFFHLHCVAFLKILGFFLLSDLFSLQLSCRFAQTEPFHWKKD